MVFCTECGKENEEDAKYCSECGNTLDRPDKVTEPVEIEKKEKVKKKSALAAVVLNIVIAGLGMAYIKQYVKAIASFIFVVILGAISYALFGNAFYLAIIGYIIVIAWTYTETKKYNENLE